MRIAPLPLVARAEGHSTRIAIEADAEECDYRTLLEASARVGSDLLNGGADLNGCRVAFLVEPGFEYVAVQWGIWRAGGVAVPLAVSHPPPELDYVVADSDAVAVVTDSRHEATMGALAKARGLRLVRVGDAVIRPAGPLPGVSDERPALMVYTSGTTGRPKGVITTHANIRAQVTTLISAWEWSADDRILLVLPLHHIHGIINVVTCALWAGARCVMMPRFDPAAVWARFVEDPPSLFMAVPTIYRKLIAAFESASGDRRELMSAGCSRLRLMVSGSAALPVSTLERWRAISGHVLLERYGMTEIGMALSNPLIGRRLPGTVGVPLPGVDLRLVDEDGRIVEPGSPGEIEVRGPSVFKEYWRRPEETRAAFRDGWFRTGDVAIVEEGCYRILGRKSVDIIKTGGYKVSALEIEEVLRTHPSVRDCAVVGADDADWGERVCAAVELTAGADLTLDDMRQWAKERLAPYKVPSAMHPVDSLPRNAMGKVRKQTIASLFEQAARVGHIRSELSE